jgi:copper homeostasis protein
MIRPRVGDFCYSSHEFGVMIDDIKVFSKAGATGVVIGVLTSDGRIDVPRTKMYVSQGCLCDQLDAQDMKIDCAGWPNVAE